MKFKNKVKKFIKDNFDLSARVGEEFWSTPYHKNQKVYFPIDVKAMRIPSFMEHYRDTYGEPKVDEFIISLLHEVGHCKTAKYEPNIVTALYVTRVTAFEEGLIDEEDEYYFNLPQEQLATDYAYAWIKTHPKRVRKFWKSIKNDLKAMGYFEIEEES